MSLYLSYRIKEGRTLHALPGKNLFFSLPVAKVGRHLMAAGQAGRWGRQGMTVVVCTALPAHSEHTAHAFCSRILTFKLHALGSNSCMPGCWAPQITLLGAGGALGHHHPPHPSLISSLSKYQSQISLSSIIVSSAASIIISSSSKTHPNQSI